MKQITLAYILAGEEAWYEPITAEDPGVKGLVANAGFGVGGFNVGTGAALGLKTDADVDGVAVVGDGDYLPVEIIDESEWVTVEEPQQVQAGGLIGAQGGVELGPLAVNGGFSVGR